MSEAEDRSAPGDLFDRWGPLAVSVAVVAVVLARLWLVFHRLFDPDELEHLHAGFCVWQGMVPYRDFFEQHGPVLWYVSLPFFHIWGASLSVLTAGRFVIWILGAASIALTWQLGNRLYGRWGGPVAALLLVLVPSFQEKNVEWRPDNVALPLVLVAVLAAERAVVQRSWRWAGIFGASLAAGFLCTQKIAYVGLGLGAGFVVSSLLNSRLVSNDSTISHDVGRPGVRGILASLLATAVGASLVLAVFVALFAAAGVLGPLFDMTVRLPLRWQTREPVTTYLAKAIFESPVFCGAGITGLLVTVTDLRRAATRQPGVLIALAGTVVHSAGVLRVPAAFLQYYLPLWPLVALFAARGALALARLPCRRGDSAASPPLQFWVAVAGLVATVGATALRWAFSPLPARWDVAFVAACVVAGVLFPLARRAAILVVIVASALAAGPFHWVQFVPWSDVQRNQRTQIERLLRATGPDDRFFDGFTGMAALRPHAFKYFWINHHSWPMLPDDAKSAGVLQALDDEHTRVVLEDVNLFKHLPAHAQRLLVDDYAIDARYSWAGCAVRVRRGRELPPPFDWPVEVDEGF